MGLDDVKSNRCKTLTFCSNTCVFIRNNPFVWGLFLLVFLVYNYFPSVFGILIYSSPVVACTIVFIKFLSRFGHSKDQNPKRNESVPVGDDDAKRNEKSSFDTQTSDRRNANEKSREWRKKNLSCRSVRRIGKLDNIQLGSFDGGSSSLHVYDAEKVQKIEEKPDSELGNGFDDPRGQSVDGGGSELETESIEEAEDEDEEGRGFGHHEAVEWNEDDEKNLMDLGTSEIERNKRLESLIAKRRANKLLKMRVEKDLIDLKGKEQVGQIAPILIARNNLLHLPNDPNNAEDFDFPGSAPSVLVPGRNPFDLPYDPQEEKPDLLGDSFQQEFKIPHQKEMIFSRHESFSIGSFFLNQSKQEPHSSKRYSDFIISKQRALEVLLFPRFKRPPPHKGDKKNSFEQNPSQHLKLASDLEGTFQGKDGETDLGMIKTEGKEASSMEPELSERNDVPTQKESVHVKNDGSNSPSLFEDKEHDAEENESSPHSNASLNGNMNKELTAVSEETWAASSHLSGVDENESRSGEVHEISEEDIIQVGFSGVNQDSEDPIALALHVGQAAFSPAEKLVKGVSSIYHVVDPPLHANDDMEDSKSIKDIDGEPPAEEPDKLAVEENDNSTSIGNLVQEPAKLTTQGSNVEEPELMENKDNLKSIQDSEGDQGNVEAGSFDANQTSDAFTSSAVEPERVFSQDSSVLIASTVQPEPVIEQISSHSSLSSSPKSVLPEKVPVEQVSSWSFNPEVHVTVQQNNMEDNSSHELLPQNFDLTSPPNAQHLMEDSVAQSSNVTDYEWQQEPSNPSGESTEANISYKINESSYDHKEEKEKKSVEDDEGKLQSMASTSQESAAESSKPDGFTVSGSIQDDEDGLEKTSAFGANIGPSHNSCPTEENAKSDTPVTLANEQRKAVLTSKSHLHETEQEPSSPPIKSTQDADIIHSLNRLEVSKLEVKKE